MENHIWEEFAARLRVLMALVRGQGARIPMLVCAASTDNPAFDEELLRVIDISEAVLVPLDEHLFVRCRLLNALAYFRDDEFGASKYELELVLRRVRQLQRLYGW